MHPYSVFVRHPSVMKLNEVVRVGRDLKYACKSFENLEDASAFALEFDGFLFRWGRQIEPITESEDELPKEKKPVGRAACMDAMCHSCEHFNLGGRRDCGRNFCPLYTYCPNAEGEADVDWVKVKPGKSVGFVPKKGVTDAELLEAVEKMIAFRYGDDVPADVQREVDAIRSAVDGSAEVAGGGTGGQGW